MEPWFPSTVQTHSGEPTTTWHSHGRFGSTTCVVWRSRRPIRARWDGSATSRDRIYSQGEPGLASEEVEVAREDAIEPSRPVAAYRVPDERCTLDPVASDDGRRGRDAGERGARLLPQALGAGRRPRLPRRDVDDRGDAVDRLAAAVPFLAALEHVEARLALEDHAAAEPGHCQQVLGLLGDELLDAHS